MNQSKDISEPQYLENNSFKCRDFLTYIIQNTATCERNYDETILLFELLKVELFEKKNALESNQNVMYC